MASAANGRNARICRVEWVCFCAFPSKALPHVLVGESGWREGRSLAGRPSCQAGGVQPGSRHPREVAVSACTPSVASRRLLAAIATAAPRPLAQAACGRGRSGSVEFTIFSIYLMFLASFRHFSDRKWKAAAEDSTGRSRTPPTARRISGFAFALFPPKHSLTSSWGSPVGAMVVAWLRDHRAKREGVQPGSREPPKVPIYKTPASFGCFWLRFVKFAITK